MSWEGNTDRHPKKMPEETLTGNIGEYDVPIVFPEKTKKVEKQK